MEMFSLYFYQINKSSSDLPNYSFSIFIAFLESVPTSQSQWALLLFTEFKGLS